MEQSTMIDSQIGIKHFISALEAEAEVIIAGMVYDPAVFACYPVR